MIWMNPYHIDSNEELLNLNRIESWSLSPYQPICIISFLALHNEWMESYLTSNLKINSTSKMISFSFKMLYSSAQMLLTFLWRACLYCVWLQYIFPGQNTLASFLRPLPLLRNPAVVMEQSEGVNIASCCIADSRDTEGKNRPWGLDWSCMLGCFCAAVTAFFCTKVHLEKETTGCCCGFANINNLRCWI